MTPELLERAATRARSRTTIAYAGTDPTDADTDGDGVRDGADDQDHDDIPNIMEALAAAPPPASSTARAWPVRGAGRAAAGAPAADQQPRDDYGRVNPFNPCLPAPWSRTCIRNLASGRSPHRSGGIANWLALN